MGHSSFLPDLFSLSFLQSYFHAVSMSFESRDSLDAGKLKHVLSIEFQCHATDCSISLLQSCGLHSIFPRPALGWVLAERALPASTTSTRDTTSPQVRSTRRSAPSLRYVQCCRLHVVLSANTHPLHVPQPRHLVFLLPPNAVISKMAFFNIHGWKYMVSSVYLLQPESYGAVLMK